MRRALAARRAAVCALAWALRAVAPDVAMADSAAPWSAARGEAELATIEARWKALAVASRRDVKALAELDARAKELSRDASRGLGAMRESAADRDADMAALMASPEWVATEELIVKLRFRLAAIELDRAITGDPDRVALARAAAEGFGAFVDAPDPTLAAEARYGRALARIALGDREAGLADLRAATTNPSTAARARIALAEALAESGQRGEALDLVTRQLAGGGLPRELELRAKLLRLRLLVAAGGGGKAAPGSGGGRDDAAKLADASALAASLMSAGEPWRSSAVALLSGHEDLLPAGSGDASALRLRADALARRGDARGALAAYKAALAAEPPPGAAATLGGIARAAVLVEDWQEAESALVRLHEVQKETPFPRDLALLELRAAYGAWQTTPSEETRRAVSTAAEALARTAAATPADRAEAAFRTGEVARASGDLPRAIAVFVAIDEPSWRIAAQSAALQSRALRHAREPAAEPRATLLRDLSVWLGRRDLPPDARAVAIAIDGTLRTESGGDGPGASSASPDPILDVAQQRAALARLREFPRAFPGSSTLLPTVLRARALLELDLGESVQPTMLDALPVDRRPAMAATIAADLRHEALAGAQAKSEPERERARRALAAAIAFGDLAPESERTADRNELANAALALGDAPLAERLFRAELEAKPRSLSALRGLALAAAAAGDKAAERAAWQRLAAEPNLPAALRDEADRHRAD